jgi:AcrR family transcriptional regulator
LKKIETPAPPPTSRARARILETAATLFYQEGVRAVGVDLVVERSGVAKTSLYRHFATKDDLVVAFLEQEDAEYWANWNAVAAKAGTEAEDKLLAHLRFIARHVAGANYRGCPFLNVATEFPAAEHPARAVAVRNKAELRRRLATLAKGFGAAPTGGAGRSAGAADRWRLHERPVARQERRGQCAGGGRHGAGAGGRKTVRLPCRPW